MKTATFRYKCRQCGGFANGASTAVDNARLVLLAIIGGDNLLASVNLGGKSMFSTTVLHQCDNINFQGEGLADLAGYIVEDK